MPLIGANVVIVGTSRGTAVLEDGSFMIADVRAGTYAVDVSMMGYEPLRQTPVVVGPGEESELSYVLSESAVELKELVVVPGIFSLVSAQTGYPQTLSKAEIRRMPHLADDAFRAAARLPGIASNDFSAGFAVRGGAHHEVLVLFDGMELFEPYHLKSEYGGGVLSVIDTEAVDGIEMMTGAFPVEYGNRLSGVFDIESSRPDHPRQRTSLGISFTNARLLSEGRFDSGRGEWLFVGRRGFVDLLLRATGGDDELGVSYQDITAKVRYNVHPRHSLAVNFLVAGDDVRFQSAEFMNEDEASWRDNSAYAWLTWTATVQQNLLARTLVSIGTLSAKREAVFVSNGIGFFYSSVDDDRKFDFVGIKHDWTYERSNRYLINGGVEVRNYDGRYDYTKIVRTRLRFVDDVPVAEFDTTESDLRPSGLSTSAFLGSRIRLSDRLSLEGGIRYDKFEWMDDDTWSPRIGLAYAFSDRSTIRLATGRFTQAQGIFQLMVEDGDETFYPAELANHFVVGLEHRFNNGIQLRLEAYTKELSDLRPFYQNLGMEESRIYDFQKSRVIGCGSNLLTDRRAA